MEDFKELINKSALNFKEWLDNNSNPKEEVKVDQE